MFHKG